MVLKKSMKYQFDKVDNKENSLTALAKSLNCSVHYKNKMFDKYVKKYNSPDK